MYAAKLITLTDDGHCFNRDAVLKCDDDDDDDCVVGRVCALNIVGKTTDVRSVPFFWIVVCGKSLRYCGNFSAALPSRPYKRFEILFIFCPVLECFPYCSGHHCVPPRGTQYILLPPVMCCFHFLCFDD